MVRTYLFDESSATEEVDWAGRLDQLSERQLLWIDLEEPSEEEVDRVAEAVGLERRTRDRILAEPDRPWLDDLGGYFHVNAFAIGLGEEVIPVELECVVGSNWILTVHDREIEVLEDFRERVGGKGELGRLDAPSFLASLLEWLIASYFRALEEVEVSLERFDLRVIEDARGGGENTLEHLAELRRYVGRLRRVLAPHREIFSTLAHPEFDLLSSSESAGRFRALAERLELALDAVGNAREMVIGSFDVFIARTGERTNRIMKTLTLASIMLLPSSVLAGIMGMNFQEDFFDNASLFWLVVAVMVLLAASTLGVARLRRWI